MVIRVNRVKGVPYRFHHVVQEHDPVTGINIMHPPGIIDREFGGPMTDEEYDSLEWRLSNPRRWRWNPRPPDPGLVHALANRIDISSMQRPSMWGSRQIYPPHGKTDLLWFDQELAFQMNLRPQYINDVPGMGGMDYIDCLYEWGEAQLNEWRWHF